ncbi:DeoR/GlpR family DNA-binding transcription regulator [Anaerosalibacter massiliensis]|uniref:Lactose phosphotransferase system repressor n=1 Tax=Anaerosalibacter massiliensis TaxID=1347392 RepID=A0A9X2S7W8_9FIRM|nr:DeoR/GlpR family DNA-binding transcription regulator [Anaerosalibacter massiliensis]MCR2044446.1 DeoR/GlpR family DNA-binding transcription regulator [Anaerosalibacter massiliensis]
MLKAERLDKILEMFNENNVIKISEISKLLDVSEMTVRRDLKILEERGHVICIHGGAKKKEFNMFRELSHNEKKYIMVEEKKHIAEMAASLIEENDIVFIGPGTTNEFIYDYLNVSYAKIITNSISIFSKFANDNRFELILVGGRIRSRTGAFVGSFANEMLSRIKVKLAFVGTNGISENYLTNSNEEEGVCQKIILNNANERYILCDNSKFNKEDFYRFYKLEDVTAIITDDKINPSIKKKYEQYVKIIN